ncbi:unnamed protein product [Moneuplotes crassus]|uniref:Uncharacterized protein n=1 Tax=Euplotes crassus TaxID=5936 RepID=A0AAD1XPY7_EUPCR|nr:unnamed protein product [Moneuplotes crassus]
MDPVYYCKVCGNRTYNYTWMCGEHTYEQFMEKYGGDMVRELQGWKESRKDELVGKCHIDAGETEKYLLRSEEAFGRILLAVWSEAKERERAYNQSEYCSINIECKLFTRKFKSLRLPKIDPYFTNVTSNKLKKPYLEYFMPMKHKLRRLKICSRTPHAKLGSHLSLITKNSFRVWALNVIRFTVPMAHLNRILVAYMTSKYLNFDQCRIVCSSNFELPSCFSHGVQRKSTINTLSLTNCYLPGPSPTFHEDSQENLKEYLKALLPEGKIVIRKI